MQHLEEGYLHAIADGEVPSDELVAVREHLDACESCRARLDAARNEAETARELIELIEVPVGPSGSGGRAMPGPEVRGFRWVRPLAWAASLVLAAGIGYMNRPGVDALLSTPPEPVSIGRIDTVFLDVPAPSGPTVNQPVEADRLKESAAPPPPQSPRPQSPAPEAEAGPPPAPVPARQQAAGARAEEVQSAKKLESKDADANFNQAVRERAANDARDQTTQLRANRPPPAAPSVAGATAESRLMAKSAADAAPTIISFPRAVELLGGRIKLIEGMVPARLEALGRTVRVIYLIDEGDLVLAQVAAPDSVNWALSGPLSADSLASLRARIK
jgi:hypothetical protein